MATRKLEVEIIGDSRSLERAFARAQKSSQEFQTGVTGRVAKVDSALSKLGAGRAALIGGAAGAGAGIIAPKVIDQIQAAVAAASDLNEQITKNQQVFGSSASAVQAWSETTAKSIGVSQSAALAATGTFGNLFTAIGITGPKAADMSRSLVKLAADLASFNNASIEDTLDAIRSGLVGEAEPLRRYGVLLSEARVQQVAMAQTGKTSAKALTDQEKAAARVAIIFRDTTKAQGDFARTSGGLANQQRILSAQVADLQANLGGLLLPTITEFTSTMVDATSAALTLADALGALGSVKIPPIEIPFVRKELPGTGGTLGSLAGTIGKNIVKFTGPQATFFGAAELAKQIGGLFDEGTVGATPELAASFEKSLNSMFTSALNTAAGKTKPDTNKVKGFGSGLTPQDLFGPLIKDIPQALQDKLLDANIAGAGPQQIRGILVQQQQALVKALDDPRLKAKGIREIKTALAGVVAAIAVQDSAIQAGVKKASDDRQARIAKAADDAKKAAAKQRAGFDKIIASLQTQFDAASLTPRLDDDVAKSKALERAILKQTKVEGRTAELVSDLAKQRQITAEKLAGQKQARQFRALGLGPTGEEIIPGVKNLQQRLTAVVAKIGDGTLNLSSKLEDHLKAALRSVKVNGKNLTDETRNQINEWIKAANGEGADKMKGPLTKTTSLNQNAALAGVTGLNRDQLKQIRANLSNFNSAGVALAGSQTGQPITVVVNTHTSVDGETVARNTTKHQEKANRRNPAQKRGPNRRFN